MLIHADWPAPAGVVALTTTRLGLADFAGTSQGPYACFNLGDHVGDVPAAVAANRQALLDHCEGLDDIAWLQQVHGVDVVQAEFGVSPLAADASITRRHGLACGVLTADCLPVLFCHRAGGQVAAAHAGWRGLCAGVLRQTLAAFDCPAAELMAWIGPAISQPHFEVGEEVLAAFLAQFREVDQRSIKALFHPAATRARHYHADLTGLAVAQLNALGVGWVGGGQYCCYRDPQRFYSYRRQATTGRQLSMIYLKS